MASSLPLLNKSASGYFSATLRKYTRVLRHRNYRIYIGGQFLTQIGTWVQMVGQSWLVYRLSHSSKMLGLIGFAEQGPILLLSLFAGAVADRVDRRRFLLLTQHLAMLQAFVLAALTLAGVIQIWHVFILSLFLGTISTFNSATRQAFVIEMVPREELVNAVALNSTSFNTGRILGSSLAGILLAVVSEGYCFLINAIGFLATIASLWMLRLPPTQVAPKTISLFQRFREGYDYALHDTPVRCLLLLLGLMSLLNYSFHQVLLPVFADQILHGGPKALGMLLAALGTGVILGAIYMSAMDSQKVARTIAPAILACSACLICFAFSGNLYFSMGMLFIVGICLMLSINGINATLQTIVRESFRGRVVGGFYLLAWQGMNPIGYLLGGWLATIIGPSWTVTSGALICAGAAIAFNQRRALIQEAIPHPIAVHAPKY